MANIEFDRTDPRSPDYDRLQHALDVYGQDQTAQLEGRFDDISFQNQRLRAFPGAGNEMSIPLEERFTYIPSIPPNFFGGENPLPRTSTNPDILPLAASKDPNAAYGRYANLSNRAYNIDNTWKTIANMGNEGLDAPGGQERRDRALSDLSSRYASLSNEAELARQEAMFLDNAYNRQIGIQTLRSWDTEAADLAGLAEQGQRDLGRLNKEYGELSRAGMPIPKGLDFRIESAQNFLDKSLGNWDEMLQRKGVYQGPKGPYLLSGAPAQFLDDIADKGARDLRLKSENIKMFQSRYMKDAPFRASVNQGLKAKVPGVLAAGLGGAMVKQKMEEGESLPKAIGTTAGEIVLGAAKFALWDRFVGPGGDLNQGENEYLYNRDRVKFVQQLDDTQMAEIEKDFPGIRKEEARVAKVLREKMKESKEVEENITNSPLWNKTK